MKKCELCKLPSRLYCESDQASLCVECDLKVHEVNFLVAKHSRMLLCVTWQAPTPWEASGARLGNKVTEYDECAEGGRGASKGVVDDDEAFVDEEAFDDNSSDGYGAECDQDDEVSESEDEEGMEEEDENENQVVPWSPTPPAASSSSSDDTSSSSSVGGSRKRVRECDADSRSQV